MFIRVRRALSLTLLGLLAAGCGGERHAVDPAGGYETIVAAPSPHPKLDRAVAAPAIPVEAGHETISFRIRTSGPMSSPEGLMGLDTRTVSNVTVGGRPLAHSTGLHGHSAVVSFDLPGASRGEQLMVTAFVSVGGYSTQRSATFTVR